MDALGTQLLRVLVDGRLVGVIESGSGASFAVAERRGTNKARIATARRLMTLVYYGLRDSEIRCFQQRAAA